MFAQPSYQRDAVERYLLTSGAGNFPTSGPYNRSGRAYPDVSAIGHNLMVVVGGVTAWPTDGTSASAPIFGAMISLINSERISAGKPSVGFINPALYAMYADNAGHRFFYDVTAGATPCGEMWRDVGR